MKTVKIGKHTVEYYDGDVTELPVPRFHAFQKHLLIASGVGSTIEDISSHVNKIRAFIEKGEHGKAKEELQNLNHNMYFVMKHISPRDYAFAALVYSVDGKEWTDFTDEGCKRLAEMLTPHQSRTWFDRVVNAVKKKLTTS